MAIHGVSIITMVDGKRETFYMASVRKHPAVGGKIKAIQSLMKKQSEMSRMADLLAQRVESVSTPSEPGADPYTDEAEFQALVDKVLAAQKKYQENEDKLLDVRNKCSQAIFDFYVEGFKGAGYGEDKSMEIAQLIDIDRYFEIRERVIAGCGCLDFTNPGSGLS